MRAAKVRGRHYSGPLFWRVFVVNGAVLVLATAVLAISPATVSSPPLRTELVVLCVGLVAMLAVNAVLLRLSMAPLGWLMHMMDTVDLLRPGQRIPEEGIREVAPVVRAFNEMLRRLEAERASSSAQALSAQEDERTRIARELHDEVGQSLTVVLLGLARAAAQVPHGVREELLQMQEVARSSLDDVRRIARRLRPDTLEELGLPAALNTLATDFSDMTAMPVHRRFQSNIPTLPGELELVIYRVAQEALTNVARHADASRAVLALSHDDTQVVLAVNDDGKGLQQPEGAGIRGMRERALFVGGKLRIDSQDNSGTQVSLQIPLQEEPTMTDPP